ncbi:MAG: ABC transporter permease [Duncaniella sp.]|nr:ABC transporter permease [Duncaniella sp.]
MKFYYLVHSMLAQKGANAIKIVSVAVGLLVSCLIFTRLAYNYSYDTCFHDYDRLYQVRMSYEVNGEKMGPFESCVGKLSWGIYSEMSEYVSAATNIYRGAGGVQLYNGEQRIDADKIASDSLFFETMGIKVLVGQPKYDLALPNIIYLSESMARELYGDESPIGRTISAENAIDLTVKGVFKDLPENVTIYPFKVVISMSTFQTQIEQRFQWSGADSWPTYMRLKSDCTLTEEQLNSKLNQMYQTHQPDTEDYKVIITATPIRDMYLDIDDVKKMNMVMWALGLSLLLMTVLNYVLITIASLSRRSKGVGIHKCSGATGATIMRMFISETLVILSLALVLMGLLLFIFQPLIKDIIDLDISQIFEPARLWVTGCILLFFILVGGFLPGRLFAKIPVTQVFRRFTDRNSAWKRSLLLVQIAGVSFVAGLLSVVAVQYNDVINYDKGFDIENRVTFRMPGAQMNRESRKNIFLGGIAAQPYVEAVTWSIGSPLYGFSGEYVYDAAGNMKFNSRIAWVDANYVKFMGINLLQGSYDMKDGDMVVNETFAKRMGWGDDAVGHHIERMGNSDVLNVVAVVKDFVVNNLSEEIPPVAFAVTGLYQSSGYALLKEPFDENYKKLETYLSETYPTYNPKLTSMKKIHDDAYHSVLLFRNSALVTAVALIFIAMMGLIGFTRDEVERRRKEIAVRKVNGADSFSIVSLITGDVFKIAIPATIIGTLCAWYVGHLWLENFKVTADNIWAYYLLSAMIVLILVVVCVFSVTWRIANENPVTQLKSE